jgi:hypothetical protein
MTSTTRALATITEVDAEVDNSEPSHWFLDSGASKHISSKFEWFSDYVPYPEPQKIWLGDDTQINAMGEGTVKVELLTDENGVTAVNLESVVYAPKIACNLLSMSQIDKRGLWIKVGNSQCSLHSKDGAKLASAKLVENGLYELNVSGRPLVAPHDGSNYKHYAIIFHYMPPFSLSPLRSTERS